MPLWIVLASAALLLAVLLVLPVAVDAIGPQQRRVGGLRLPNFSDGLLRPKYAA